MSASSATAERPLTADRSQIESFVDVLFRYADAGGFVHLRAFRDDAEEGWGQWVAVPINGAGLDTVVDAAARLASACAAAPSPVVFCPPVATFKSNGSAAEKDVSCGLVLSVECDAFPGVAKQRLQLLLGPPTAVVESGGIWTDPETGELIPKLHLHWRLQEPTRGFADHVRLKEARRSAMALVGADASAVPLCHPLRWPGSWHRKAAPRLASIVELNPNAEIDLGEAYERLSEAAETIRGEQSSQDQPGARASSDPQADLQDINAALAAIPNDKLDWEAWNRAGMATWRATGGSEAGYAAFAAWSAKSSKDTPSTTRARWAHYSSSPPNQIGAGSLFHLAAEALTGWQKPSSYARRAAAGAATSSAPSSSPGMREFPIMADEAFIGLAGDIVRAIEPHTESDPVGLLLSAHAFFGNCIGRGPHYKVESTEHGTNLYVIKVGDTAKARKGTGENHIRSIFRQVDEGWERHCVHTGLSSGEGLIWAVRNPITKMVKDKKTGDLIQETIDDGVSDKRLMIIESEFAGTLQVMQREGNILSRIMRDGWDCGDLASLTKNSPACASGVNLSFVGHITDTELKAYFDRTEMANGFGNRFLFACLRRARMLPFGGALRDGDVAKLSYEIRRAVAAARNIREVSFAPDAREIWCEIYPDLSGDRPGLLGSLTARSEAQAVRLASLYALWAGANQIGSDHLMAALAVEGFCRKSVEYIFGDMLGDPVADTILEALRAAGSDGLTRTEINNLFSRHASSNQIANALSELARRRLAAQRRGTSTGGRTPEIWIARHE